MNVYENWTRKKHKKKYILNQQIFNYTKLESKLNCTEIKLTKFA